MKILQLLCFPLYGSGSGTYVRKLSETLVENGDEVAIVAPESREVKGTIILNGGKMKKVSRKKGNE